MEHFTVVATAWQSPVIYLQPHFGLQHKPDGGG